MELSETVRENSGTLLPENHASVSFSNFCIKKAASVLPDAASAKLKLNSAATTL